MTDNEIITRINEECEIIENLTYSDLEGLFDGEEDPDFDKESAVWGYHENAINGVFSEIARETGKSYDDIEAIYHKNQGVPK